MNTQTSYFKKALVVLMAVMMVFTMMPGMAWAEGENAVQPVNIYVTLALDSDSETKEFAKAKDGTDMAMKSVTVSDVDNDGKLTAYDAIACMQTQYAPEGKDWAVDDKNVITKLWGEEAPFLVYKDNVMQMPGFNKSGLKSAPNNFSISNGMQLCITQGLNTNFLVADASLTPAFSNLSTLVSLENSEFCIYSRSYFMKTSIAPSKPKPVAETSGEIKYKKIGSDKTGTLSCDDTGKIIVKFSEAGEYLVYTNTTNGAAAILVKVLEKAPKITNLEIADEFEKNILSEENGEYVITLDEDNVNGNIWLSMDSDAVLGQLYYGWQGVANKRNYSLGTNCKNQKIEIGTEEAIKLYLYDRNIGAESELAKASTIDVRVEKAAVLSDLTTSGQTKDGSNFKSGTLYAYVKSDAQTATITPQVSGDGYSLTIDGKNAEAGKAHRVYLDMSSGESISTVTVSKEGRKDKNYQVVFLAAPAEATPFFVENLKNDKIEYIVNDEINPLKVYATASGDVEYQWYVSNSESDDGTAIEGATKAEYTPSNEIASDVYYYCIATNTEKIEGQNTATSERAHVVVYNTPVVEYSWDVGEIPDLPSELADKFNGNTKGFYYDKETSDEEILPLKVKAVISEDVLAAGAKVDYIWYVQRGTSIETSRGDEIQMNINRAEGYTGGTTYRVTLHISFLGRVFSDSTERLYVYTDFKDHVPSDISWSGDGSKENPWLLTSTDDIVQLRDYVNAGYDFFDNFLKFDNDISLPENWVPIGKRIDENEASIKKGANLYAFSGTIDGNNHLLTVPEGEKPLLGYVQGAEVKNLNILGKRIEGYGLVDNFAGVGLVGDAIIIDHVTLKEGTQTLKSGLIGGEITENPFAAASAGFKATIRNCTIEKGVVIGYSGEMSKIGSFAGALQGTIENCTSYATVKGKNMVGGIIGTRDNAMGTCRVENCQFYGNVTGEKYVGGIVGSGYWNGTAPNGIKISISNCKNAGTVEGVNHVGGILGGDAGVTQAWNLYSFIGNVSSGKVSGESNVGAIIGYYKGLNKWDNVAYNFYTKECEAAKGIGLIEYIDTNYENPTVSEGTTYFNTQDSVAGCPEGWTRVGCNRTDDPLGKDAETLTKRIEDASVNICYKIEVEGSFKDTYYIGEKLDLTGADIKAKWTNGDVTILSQDDLTITGYDKSKRAVQTVTLSYQGISTTIEVVVLERVQPGDNGINVTFTLLGDSLHDADAEGATKHTLSAGNLQPWLTVTKTVKKNSTVWDLMQEIESSTQNPAIKFNAEGTQYGTYIYSVTYNGTEIGEFDNGKKSGWMYTVNGTHPEITVGAYFLSNGDKIIFHYTDDYDKEEGSDKWSLPTDEVKDVTTDTKTGVTTAPTEVKVSEKTAADGTKEKVAEVKVSADNQKEILKQAKDSNSKEIILVVSKNDVKDATKAELTLDKSFLESIVKDTDAKLTIKTPFGDKTYTKDELKALIAGASGTTVILTIEKSAELDEAAKLEKAKELTASLALTARSAKTAKKNVKVSLKMTKASAASISELQDLGYTVKYKFYRSTKKASKYAAKLTKTSKTYLNTSGAKGSKYYYKARVLVYDQDGKLVTYSKLTQCKYAARTWTK